MKSAESPELMTFETAYGALFLNRYNNANQPMYCDIYDNHIDFNTNSQTSNVYFWTGNLSAYNTENDAWLYIPSGSTVTLKVTYGITFGYTNMLILLKEQGTSGNVNWLSTSNGSATSGKPTVTASKTATEDTYCYLSFSCTPAGRQYSIDVEISINGVRVL